MLAPDVLPYCDGRDGPTYFERSSWTHGDIQSEIAQTWLGFVGPGVRGIGTWDLWTDHTDARPTMLMLPGLEDVYVHDRRTIIEPVYDGAVPQPLPAHRDSVRTRRRPHARQRPLQRQRHRRQQI